MRTGRALAADVICLLVFAIVGRSSHGETTGLTGVLHTAWPFLVGGLVGTVVGRLVNDPFTLRAGACTWLGALVLGMALRAATGAGVAISFVVVTAVVLAVLLLGWRGIVALVSRFRLRRARTV
ncbi:DUF3054 domain-containing protein [uncultured Friedmanniella sp.]|uniref:DUF3054 domain-containing protein n=1 Tax=uncultured Friedmanniella sp. TaxID=335381 RepID=UPI0035CABC91